MLTLELIVPITGKNGITLFPGTIRDFPEEIALHLIEMGHARGTPPVPDLLTRIKAILSRDPVPYSEVLIQTGASEDEIREAIRDWYGLISGKIQGKGEEFHWWIDPVSTKESIPEMDELLEGIE